jgi:hypothetical protein
LLYFGCRVKVFNRFYSDPINHSWVARQR